MWSQSLEQLDKLGPRLFPWGYYISGTHHAIKSITGAIPCLITRLVVSFYELLDALFYGRAMQLISVTVVSVLDMLKSEHISPF